MGLSLDEIKGELIGGGARATQFEIQVFNPIDQSADRKLKFMAKASSVPSVVDGKIEVPYQGRKYNVAGDRIYPDWTVTIMNDEDYLVRKAFQEWKHAINEPVENVRNNGASSNPTSYKSRGQVVQLGKEGQRLAVYNMEGIWPLEISDIPLAWDANDQIEEFTVTFSIDYWTFGDDLAS